MRKKCGIDATKPCALVISGSIGGEFLHDVVTTFQDEWRRASHVDCRVWA